MTTTARSIPATAPTDDEARRDALVERLVGAAIGALELFSVHVGRELDLYTELADEPVTYPELAERAGIAPRYAREWLEQQAVAGLLDASPDESAEHRTYAVARPYRAVLLDPEQACHVAPLADMVAGVAGVLGRLPEAYRSGAGVPYAAYGRAFRRGQGGINRPLFRHDLSGWLAVLPDVMDRCGGESLVRVADVGCGEGWSTVALARALPAASVDGYDSDQASIAAARRHATEAGVADRVTFHLVDAADDEVIVGPYDLILIFEALHDLARPDRVLAAVRAALAEHGTALVADERVADAFTAPGDDVERFMYGWSVTHCLPASLADAPSAGLGTVLRAGTVHELARRAGFARSADLPIQHDLLRFYRLDR